MTLTRILKWLIVATCWSPATILAQNPQPGPVIDLAGEWAAQVHEDAIYRGAGGFLEREIIIARAVGMRAAGVSRPTFDPA